MRKPSVAVVAGNGGFLGPEIPDSVDLLGDAVDALVPVGGAADDVQFLDGLLGDAAQVQAMDWYTADALPFSLSTPGPVSLPMECWPGVRELDAPPGGDEQTVAPTDRHFEALSRLNIDIHRGWDNMLRFATQPSFQDFICSPHPTMDGFRNLQLLMKNVQEFLGVIKALHRQVGTRPVSGWGSSRAVSLSGSTTPSDDNTADASPPPASHDSATMFLVISCYVQLIRHVEMVLRIIHDTVTDPSSEPLGRAPMAYAEVPIAEASSQFILFCELVRHLVAQMNLVLGLPSPWAARSAWTGLLRQARHRDMVNAELGAVEGLWTTRPARVVELTGVCREVFVEISMMGLDSR